MYRIALCALVLVACKQTNPSYCDENTICPGGGVCDLATHSCGAGIDAAPPDARIDCARDEDCAGHCVAMVCADCTGDLDCQDRSDGLTHCGAAGACVECNMSDDCALGVPVCQDQTCVPCTTNAQCEMRADVGEIGLCRPGGSCLGAMGAMFVDDDMSCPGDGASITPFCEIQLAVDAVDGGDPRTVVIVRPGSYSPVDIQDVAIELRGKEGAIIEGGSSDIPRIEIQGASSDALVAGFEITGASASGTAGIYCRGGATCRLERLDVNGNHRGIFAENATMLRLEQSRIRGNQGGGIATFASDFSIVNNLIHQNGRFDSSLGAASLGTSGSAREFRHNTVWRNFVNTGSTPTGGVSCAVTTTLSSNIFWDNDGNDVSDPVFCVVDHSVIQDAVIGTMNGNTQSDPRFVDEDPLGPDLHIMTGSPCIDTGLVTGAPLLDFFGQARDAMPDMGADELGAP